MELCLLCRHPSPQYQVAYISTDSHKDCSNSPHSPHSSYDGGDDDDGGGGSRDGATSDGDGGDGGDDDGNNIGLSAPWACL